MRGTDIASPLWLCSVVTFNVYIYHCVHRCSFCGVIWNIVIIVGVHCVYNGACHGIQHGFTNDGSLIRMIGEAVGERF